MSVTLSDLTARLTAAVSARNGVPSAAQYTQAVKDAVGGYSQRVTIPKHSTLSIVSGMAGYALPSDFLFVVKLPSASNPSGVIVSDAGLVPVGAPMQWQPSMYPADARISDWPSRWNETWNITGLTITFYPTPTYTMTRELWYAAGHVLDSNSAYPDMVEDDARIALLLAQSLALTLKANAAADEAWNYSIGPESVNKTVLAAAIRGQAEALRTQYEEAVVRRIGSVGVRADYDVMGA
jgi:hypothetical protein